LKYCSLPPRWVLEVYCEWLLGSAYWEPLMGVHCGQVSSGLQWKQGMQWLGYEHCGCRDVGRVVLVVARSLEPESVGFVSTANHCETGKESAFWVRSLGSCWRALWLLMTDGLWQAGLESRVWMSIVTRHSCEMSLMATLSSRHAVCFKGLHLICSVMMRVRTAVK
jgi:hypothetical protein